MAKIKIKDLDVDLAEIMKKDPKILDKIRGGAAPSNVSKVMLVVASTTSTSSSATKTCPGKDTMYCCTGTDSGCEPGQDTMYCSTKGRDCYFTY